MSAAKKMILVSTLTFLALVVAGAMWGHHGGDPTGTTTGGLPDYLGATGSTGNGVPVSQSGLNALATETGHLRISINFTWVLLTGFLVLFMQVGFAFLVTGLTRAKNAGHMMMMNIAVVRDRVARVLRGRVRVPCSAASRPSPTSAACRRSAGIFGHGSAGRASAPHGFFLQTGGGYDVGVMVLFLFQVVFMETAGYIIIGAIAERISFAGFILAEIAMGAIIYPIYGMWVWGGGWLAHLGQSLHLGHGAVDFAGSGVVHATGGWAALALAMLLGPRIGKFSKDGTPNAIPGHNLGYVVIGTLVLVFGWMGFNPGSTLGATDLRIGVVAVNTLLAGVRRLRDRDGVHEREVRASPTSRCRATACSPASSPSPRRARSSRRGRRSSSASIAGLPRVLQRLVLRPRRQGRRPVRRDLGARRVRRVGRARGRPVRRRHVRRGLERRRAATSQGLFYGDARPARRADVRRRRRLHLGVGHRRG